MGVEAKAILWAIWGCFLLWNQKFLLEIPIFYYNVETARLYKTTFDNADFRKQKCSTWDMRIRKLLKPVFWYTKASIIWISN